MIEGLRDDVDVALIDVPLPPSSLPLISVPPTYLVFVTGTLAVLGEVMIEGLRDEVDVALVNVPLPPLHTYHLHPTPSPTPTWFS